MPTVSNFDMGAPRSIGTSDVTTGSFAPAATPPVDGTPTEAAPVVEAEKKEAMSPKLVELARRAKAQRAAQIKLQQEQQALATARADIERKQREYETNYIPKDRLQNDFLGVLADAGISPEQIQNYFMQQPTASVELKLQQAMKRIEELENGTKTFAKNQEEQAQQNYETAINQIRNDAKVLVNTDPSFELVKEMRAEEEVVNLIKRVYTPGTVLSVDDAAAQVEDYLFEEATRVANLSKVKQKLVASASVDATTKQTQQPQNKQQPIKTITNSMVASPTKPLSPAERRARAIAIAEGRLQN
jgi:hypothetical protein